MKFTKRTLRLWGIGVGSVLGGDFFGWTTVLQGGIGSGLLIVFLIGILYALLALSSIILMTITRKSSGGAPALVHDVLGEKASLLVASFEMVKMYFVVPILAMGVVSYLSELMGDNYSYQVLAFIFLHLVFSFVAMQGTVISGSIQAFLTIFSLVVLIFFWILILPSLNFQSNAVYGGEEGTGSASWFDSGFSGFLATVQFGCWFFLGFEELPLLALSDHLEELQAKEKVDRERAEKRREEEGLGVRESLASSSYSSPPYDVRNDAELHSALILSFLTVLSCSLLNTLLVPSAPPGLASLSSDASPIRSCLSSLLGHSDPRSLLVQYSVSFCLLAPFLSFLLFAAHQTQSLSVQGLLPVILATQISDHVPRSFARSWPFSLCLSSSRHKNKTRGKGRDEVEEGSGGDVGGEVQGENEEDSVSGKGRGVSLKDLPLTPPTPSPSLSPSPITSHPSSHFSTLDGEGEEQAFSPSVAILLTAAFSTVLCCVMARTMGLDGSSEALINMCLWPALLSYCLQLLASLCVVEPFYRLGGEALVTGEGSRLIGLEGERECEGGGGGVTSNRDTGSGSLSLSLLSPDPYPSLPISFPLSFSSLSSLSLPRPLHLSLPLLLSLFIVLLCLLGVLYSALCPGGMNLLVGLLTSSVLCCCQ